MNRMVRAAAVAALLQVIPTLAQPVLPPMPTNSVPETAEQRAAREARYVALLETNRASVLEFLHDGLTLPDGNSGSLQEILDTQALSYAGTAADVATWQQSSLDSALTWASAVGAPTELALEKGTTAYLVSIDEFPLYVGPCNVEAAVTIGTDRVWPGGSAGLSLSGTNRTIYMWDEGKPRLTHSEFAPGRVSVLASNNTASWHSTGVAGTLVAGGYNSIYSNGIPIGPAARGMSFGATLMAGSSRMDMTEMPALATTNKMRLSNHSYEHQTGWVHASDGWYWMGNAEISTNADPKFGNYTAYAATLDYIAQTAANYLGVWAAGNDPGFGPPVQPTNHYEYNLQYARYSTNSVHPANGDAGGYDSISDLGCAKNILTVGAVYPLYGGYTGPTNVFLAEFSSCGPTDDGRIKPDVVGDGVWLITVSNANDYSYMVSSGTSFSAPSVAGSLNLLAERYQQLHTNGAEMLSSTLKGLVVHTADPAGTNAGPNYRFGWGLMNTASAAALLSRDGTNANKDFLKEVLLANGTYVQFPIVSSGADPLKVTICWTDPAGPPSSLTNLNNPTPSLVNDLDLRLIGPNGSTNFPWVLNPDLTNRTVAARSSAAGTGDNVRDNVEQICLTNPASGTYTVRVTHKGNLLSNAAQWVSILLSGTTPQQPRGLNLNQAILTATNTLGLGWPSVAGQRYQVKATDVVRESNTVWTSVGPLISARLTNVVTEVPFSPTNAQKFYRIVVVE